MEVIAIDCIDKEAANSIPALVRMLGGEFSGAGRFNRQVLLDRTSLRQSLLLASQHESIHWVAEYFTAKVAALSGLAQDQIELSTPVLNLGIDSSRRSN